MENHDRSVAPHEHSRHNDKNTLMTLLAYIGPLVIISYLVAKDDAFVKFHIKQGLIVFAIEVASWVIMSIIPYIWILWRIVHLFVLILSVIGVVNVAQGKEKELPLVGQWGKNFKI